MVRELTRVCGVGKKCRHEGHLRSVGSTGWPKKVSHYQINKKNRIKACQWD